MNRIDKYAKKNNVCTQINTNRPEIETKRFLNKKYVFLNRLVYVKHTLRSNTTTLNNGIRTVFFLLSRLFFAFVRCANPSRLFNTTTSHATNRVTIKRLQTMDIYIIIITHVMKIKQIQMCNCTKNRLCVYVSFQMLLMFNTQHKISKQK